MQAIKNRLDECGVNFNVIDVKGVHELNEDHMQEFSYQSNITELESAVETKSFQKEEEGRQRSVGESNFLVDMFL
jgi:hypothetical protein